MRFVMRPAKRQGTNLARNGGKNLDKGSVKIDSLTKREFVQKCLDRPTSLEGEQRIPVIAVIERWALCHHLGCVVKFLARSGRNPALLADLEKAKWYLERELTRPKSCSSEAIGTQSFTTEDVLEDWGLSFHLSEVLYHIKGSKSPSLREESLKQALKHLQVEIAQIAQKSSETNFQQGDNS